MTGPDSEAQGEQEDAGDGSHQPRHHHHHFPHRRHRHHKHDTAVGDQSWLAARIDSVSSEPGIIGSAGTPSAGRQQRAASEGGGARAPWWSPSRWFRRREVEQGQRPVGCTAEELELTAPLALSPEVGPSHWER